MNKIYRLEDLQYILENPMQQSGLYMIDTDLSDADIESFISSSCLCNYLKEELVSTKEGNIFELFVIGLSHRCNDSYIADLRTQLLLADTYRKAPIVYSLLILIIKHLCDSGRTVLHIHGKVGLGDLSSEDLDIFKAALSHHNETVLVISKNKSTSLIRDFRNVILNSRYRKMENRLNKVHISYKHDKEHEAALKAIVAGLKKNDIAFSIDQYDILYRDSIDQYEIEIGACDIVIMFVIPAYFESLDCMFEMTQIFMNGNLKERVFPVVDMGDIPRNGDGLQRIKEYWKEMKVKKLEQAKIEVGGSQYIINELQRIDEIIRSLDDLWVFICRQYTGKYEALIENDAELLMGEIIKAMQERNTYICEQLVPSCDTMPAAFRHVEQKGEKPIYIENNMGSITIN